MSRLIKKSTWELRDLNHLEQLRESYRRQGLMSDVTRLEKDIARKDRQYQAALMEEAVEELINARNFK